MAETSDYPEFPVPEGFSPPEDFELDKSFDQIVTVKVKPDGKTMCLLAVSGLPISKSQSTEKKSVGQRMVDEFRSKSLKGGAPMGAMMQSAAGAGDDADY